MLRAVLTAVVVLVAAPAFASASADNGEHAAGSPDKIVCKRFLETGSLVKGYRTCKTKREWERDRDNLRQSVTTNSCGGGEGGACGGS